MSADVEHMRALYAEQPTARPKVGDRVTVDGLPGVFTVESSDAGLYTLRSKHGATCRAGVWTVRPCPVDDRREG